MQKFALILLLTVFTSCVQAAAQITKAAPEAMVLIPGKGGVITLQGRQLEQLKGVLVKRNKSRTRDITARLQKGRAKATITVNASSRALGDYSLEVQTGAKPYIVPVKVVAAAEMQAAITTARQKSSSRKTTNNATAQKAQTPKIAAVSPTKPILYTSGEVTQINVKGSNLEAVGDITVKSTTKSPRLGNTRLTVNPNKLIKKISKSNAKLAIQLQAVKGIASGSYTLQIPLGTASNAAQYSIPVEVKSPRRGTSSGASPTTPAPAIQAFTATKITNNVAVKAGDKIQFQLSPALPTELEGEVTIRLVEANKNLSVAGENIASISRRYEIQVPQGLALGPHTVEISAGEHSDSSDIYVYPSVSPELASIASPYGAHPSGAIYVDPNQPITLTTNGGGFDSAKAEVKYPQGWIEYNVQKNNATSLSTGNAISFLSTGALKIRLNFRIDAPAPSFVAGASSGSNQNGFMFKSGQYELPIYVAGKPTITSCTTPGAPSHPNYANPIFPGVDLELTGENLFLPATNSINPSAGLGTSANNATPGAQIMQGSTAQKLILRLPPNPNFTNMGAVFTVNNGVATGSSSTPSCIPNSVLLRVDGIQPATLFSDPATTDVTISGAYLGWLAESVSLNGVQANIQQRNDHSLVVRWSQPISTGQVIVTTRAGNALSNTNQGKLTVANQ